MWDLTNIAHLRQECHNSKFGIFELLLEKETSADSLLTGRVSKRSLQNSSLESSCVVVALIKNYSTLKPLNDSPEKSQILSCDTVVANERYVDRLQRLPSTNKQMLQTFPIHPVFQTMVTKDFKMTT
jgi:hypothetical protein